MKRKRIAMVVQRYGEEVNGGAELLARWLAEHLNPHVDVEVITTCAVDYFTWDNHYPPGDTIINGVLVHRFPVDEPRTSEMVDKTAAIFLKKHTLFDEYLWVKEQGPYSSQLLDYIDKSQDKFDFFIFSTYLYAPTFFGMPLVSKKAIFTPNAHEEPYIKLPAFRALFHLPQAIVYNTEPEMYYVNELTGNGEVPGLVAGIGINVPEDISAGRFREKFNVHDDFILYIGRVDESKNVPQLIDYFVRYRAESGKDLKLLLIGKTHINIPERDDILALGFVSEQDKFDCLAASRLLVVPSLYESLSMVTLESWLTGKPVLVNGRCTVLKHQCRISNGGLYYHTFDEFFVSLSKLLEDSQLAKRLGEQGGEFVRQRYDWDIVVAKYLEIFRTLSGE